MYCPRCGNQQINDEIRFCVKCGLSLGGSKLLLDDGAIGLESRREKSELSPRAKGVLQGIAIIPVSIGAWFVLDIFYETVLGAGIMGGVLAMLTLIFAVAIGRVIHAIRFEQGREKSVSVKSASQFPVLDGGGATTDRLSDKVVDLRVNARDAETQSVTENTTHRLERGK